MPLFGPSHLTVLALIACTAAGFSVWANWDDSGRTGRVIAWLLAGVLLAERAALVIWVAQTGQLVWTEMLPMHLCDWAVFAVVLALLFRWRVAYVLAFFWGLAGTVQALLTPDLAYDFPDFRFITFFAAHGTIVIGVLFLTFTTDLRPRGRDLWIAFGALNVYALCAGMVNLLTGANYGYLRAKPAHGSLMDYLGPWPIYIICLEALALVSFALCYLPFWLKDRRA